MSDGQKKKRKNYKSLCFLPVSLWPALAYIPACVDIIRMLCVRRTPASFFFSCQPVGDCNGWCCLMKAWKQRSSVCVLTNGMCMPVSEPCIDAQIKHMINKINSTSPLLVTQHWDQGMWKWKQRGWQCRKGFWFFRQNKMWKCVLCDYGNSKLEIAEIYKRK